MNKLAHDLDIDQAWEEYSSIKKKKKKQFWIFLLPLFLFGLVIIFLTSETNDTEINSALDAHHPNELITTKTNQLSELTPLYMSSDEPSPTVESQDIAIGTSLPIPNNEKLTDQSSSNLVNYPSDPITKNLNESKPRVSESLASSAIIEQTVTQKNENTQKWASVSQHNTNDDKMPSSKVELTFNNTEIKRRTDIVNYLYPKRMAIVQNTSSTLKGVFEIPEYSSSNLFAKSNVNPNVHLSFGMEYSSFNRKLKGQDIRFVQRRITTERPLESIRLNLTLGKYLSEHIYIFTGISLGQYRTKIDNRYTIFESVVLEDAVVEIIKTDNAITEIIGPVSATVIKNKRDILYQRYIDFSIPIGLGYWAPISKDLGIDASLGISISPFTSVNGRIHQSYFSVDDYSSLKDLSYSSSVHLQGISALKLTWKMNNRNSLFIGGQYRIDLTNRIKSLDTSSDKFNSRGISLGINMNMN